MTDGNNNAKFRDSFWNEQTLKIKLGIVALKKSLGWILFNPEDSLTENINLFSGEGDKLYGNHSAK